ncbi:YHS domain-containing protein, partial [Zoogloea sp.]|uniref:YHS domain-containing protein n=1 Tax=Zoogloea sp. TaxID=49181 RepID=UPI001AC16BF9
RPRIEHYRKLQAEGKRYYNPNLPMLCQTCQVPLIFTGSDDPTLTSHRQVEHGGETYHFCSDGCHDIFISEPDKYVSAWLPAHQILQGNCFEADADPSAAGFQPDAEVMRYFHVLTGQDNMDYEGSPDEANWQQWKGLQRDDEAKAA